MNNNEAIRNFMHFTYNFTPELLWGMFEATEFPLESEDKFHDIAKRLDLSGTDTLFKWYMELSEKNQLAVAEYITLNYKCDDN